MITRCTWGDSDPLYIRYHDEEWGRPTVDDDGLFEKLCLEGFQAGLAWITILRKREDFRRVFHHFEIDRVAQMGPADVERLLGDASIVRHRKKIEATIHNAARAQALRQEFGSLLAYVRTFAPGRDTPAPVDSRQIPAITDVSKALSRDLKKRGWSFVGPTTVYAFMQAMGVVNDHVATCFVRDEVEAERRAAGW